jgi:glycosyltransferase involved in cell wall biosynthesis
MDLKTENKNLAEHIDTRVGIHDKSIRVMHVTLNLDIGGAQEALRTLAKQMAEKGHQPVVCSFKDGPLRTEIEGAGIPVEILPERHYSFLALPQFILEWIEIRKNLLALIKKYRIDVIQTHILQSLDFLVATISTNNQRPAIFWTIQNEKFSLQIEDLPRHRWLLGIKRYIYRLLFKRAIHKIDGLIAVSEQVKQALIDYVKPAEQKITVICNAVDVERYQNIRDDLKIRESLGIGEDSCVALVVAILKVQKGHKYLIDAAAELIPEYPKLHFLLAGDGILREELVAHTNTLGIQNHVHFLGNRKEIPELLAGSDYFVLPSLWEGLPLALIEAMASGLPIVATNVSGSKQVMIDGQTGLLVPPGDSHELALALRQLISQPQLSREMGDAARRRIEESFNAEKQTEEHIDLYLKRLRLRDGLVTTSEI